MNEALGSFSALREKNVADLIEDSFKPKREVANNPDRCTSADEMMAMRLRVVFVS